MQTLTAPQITTAASVSRVSALCASRTMRFLVIGGVSTLIYLALYAALRSAMPAQAANLLSLLLTGDLNTVANRRWTFGLTGRTPITERFKGIGTYLISLVTTSVALAALEALGTDNTLIELAALLLANAVAGIAHYLLLRHWAFESAVPVPVEQTGAYDRAAAAEGHRGHGVVAAGRR